MNKCTLYDESNIHLSISDHIVTVTCHISIVAVAKVIYFFCIGSPAGPSINAATAFTRSMVRLLDVDHTAGRFLIDEFGYQVARVRILILRWLVLLFAFTLPALVLWVARI